MSAPENSIPVEVLDAAIRGWFGTVPDTKDQQQHFRHRMRSALAAAKWSAPAAGDALDAARYRWLRHEGREEKHQDDGAIYVRQVQLTSGVITGSAVLVEEDLDAAIDAALAAQVPHKGDAA